MDHSNIVYKIACTTITEYVASWYIRHSCANRGVATSKTSQVFSRLPWYTGLATVNRRKQNSLWAKQKGNMKTSQFSSAAGASICTNVMCSIYQKSLIIYLLNEFLHSFSFEHVTENALCNSAKSFSAWKFTGDEERCSLWDGRWWRQRVPAPLPPPCCTLRLRL